MNLNLKWSISDLLYWYFCTNYVFEYFFTEWIYNSLARNFSSVTVSNWNKWARCLVYLKYLLSRSQDKNVNKQLLVVVTLTWDRSKYLGCPVHVNTLTHQMFPAASVYLLNMKTPDFWSRPSTMFNLSVWVEPQHRLVIVPSRNINQLSCPPDQFGEEVIWKEAQADIMGTSKSTCQWML